MNSQNRISGLALVATLVLLNSTPRAPAQTGPGYALDFNGTNASVSVPTTWTVPWSTDPYTIEAWIKPNAMGNCGIVTWGDYGITNGMNSLSLRTNGLANSWWGNDLVYTNTGLAGAWNHVAVVSEGTTWRVIYLNGVLVRSNAVSGTHSVPTPTSITIGKLGPSNYFNGTIDEVRVWDQPRNQIQIQTNRFTRLVLPVTGGLRAYWRMDEGAGTTAADSAAGGYNGGTLINGPTWVRSGAPFVPEGTTTNATAVTTASAKLNARVHPGNLPAKAWFQWGLTTNYGSATAPLSVGPDLPADTNRLYFDVGSVLTNLAVNTTYHYRIAVTNSVGTNYGLDNFFTTELLPAGPGRGLALDGVDDYVALPNAVWFTGDFTLEAWVYARTFNNYSRVFDFGNGPGLDEVLFALTTDTSGRPYFEISPAARTTAPDPIPLNRWVHLAATLSGTTTTLYVNGVPVVTGTSTVPSAVTRFSNFIGRSNYGADSFADVIFDELRVWNVARNATQIQGFLGRPLAGNEPGLVAYWKLDETTGTLAADTTGHGYDGTLVNGPLWTNSTVPFGPFVLTLPATNLTTTTATLGSSVNPEGFASTAWFQWGTNTSYGNTTAATNAGAGTNTIAVSTNIGALPSFATYHFRAVAANVYGTNYGQDNGFWLGAPIATTLPAYDITTNAATVSGTAVASGPSAQAWFQLGANTNYGSNTVLVAIGNGTVPVAVTNRIAGLQAGGTYHYRIVSTNAFGIDYGDDLTFTNPIFAVVANLTGTDWSGLVWADFDNDGDLDLLMTGHYPPKTILYANTGGVLSEVAVPMTDVAAGGLAVGDCNNDGWLDLLLTGVDGSWIPRSAVWTNTGAGWSLAATPTAVCLGGVAWGDYDNDGRLDFVLTGATNNAGPNAVVEIWHNTGTGFARAISLPGVYYSSATWADYNNDGWLDILVTGVADGTTDTYVTRLYRNNGNGTFSPVSTSLPGICFGQAAWGDYDNDGNQDLLLTGKSASGFLSAVYRNLGNGFFADINAGLMPFGGNSGGSSCAWGDFDSDGWPDIVLMGLTNSAESSASMWIYHNNANGTFAAVPTAGLIGSYKGALAVGDYDKDGRPDIVAAGWNYATRLYRNCWPTTNTPPTPPGNLVATVIGTNALLTWAAGGDGKTPSAGLSYNLRVGTAPGLANVVNPLATGNGWRRVALPGNAQESLITPLTGLKYGSNYYWSVQAIDPSSAGSAFAGESMFTVTRAPTSAGAQLGSIMGNSAVISAWVYPNGTNTTAYIQWGATASYGNSTPVQSLGGGTSPVALRQFLPGLQPGTLYHYRIVTSNAYGTTYGPDQTFYVDASVVLGDTNGDGVLGQQELNNVLASYWATSPWLYLTNVAGLGGTNVVFTLNNSAEGSFSVLMSTNLANWQYLGPARPRFEFTDTNAPALPRRYYRLSWP